VFVGSRGLSGAGQQKSKLSREPIEAKLCVHLRNGAMIGDMVSFLENAPTIMTQVKHEGGEGCIYRLSG